ncbi:MAG: hypothetical protein QXV95_01585 [Sulfolobales archaeon]
MSLNAPKGGANPRPMREKENEAMTLPNINPLGSKPLPRFPLYFG